MIKAFWTCVIIFFTISFQVSNNALAEEAIKLSPSKPIKLVAKLNKTNLSIGDPFIYTITLYQLDKTPVTVLKPGKKVFKNLNFINLTEKIKFLKNNIKATEFNYYLQIKDITGVIIPEFVTTSSKITSKIPSFQLKVLSSLDKKQKMKDIHDIKPIETFFIFNYWILLIPILVLITASTLIYIILKIFKKKKRNIPVVIIPPHLVALENLEKLKHSDLKTFEEIKIFYTNISDIMRIYIEDRFSVNAIEKTTEEINTELNSIPLELKSKTLIKSILINSDLVKFAKYYPVKDEAVSCLNKSIDFVEITKPKEEINNLERDNAKV